MADPEIKIKVTLDTPDDPWAKFKQQVVVMQEKVRSVFAAAYENDEQKTAAINAVGDILDELVYAGAEIEKTFKKIGVSPEQKAELEAFLNLLNNATAQFERGLDRKETPTQPTLPQLEGGDWIQWQGPEVDAFKEKMAELNAVIAEYQNRIKETRDSNEALVSALNAELAALDKTASGYEARKQALETMLATTQSSTAKISEQNAALEKQKEAVAQLYQNTSDTGAFEENLHKLDELNNKVVATSEKAQSTFNAQQTAAEKYAAKMAQIRDKELKQQEKLNHTLQLQGKTYEELTQLYTKLMEARKQAKTQEDLAAIDSQLQALQRQIMLTGREAQLSGAKIIGSQTSVRGVFRSSIDLWKNGRLTLEGLTAGVKMFAKSTILLAAMQLAWELLTNLWEKGKEALFGVSEASETAAEKQEKLAQAAKDASDNLLAAQDALAMSKNTTFEDAIKKQNEEYAQQLDLINQITAAQLRQVALTSKDDEREIALEKLNLQEQLKLGLIDEFAYKEKLIDLELKAKTQQGLAALKKKETEQADSERKAQQARNELKEAESLRQSYNRTPEQLKLDVASYNAWKTDLEETSGKINELKEERSSLELKLKVLERIGGENGNFATRMATKLTKTKLEANEYNLRSLNLDYGEQEQKMLQVYSSLPQFVRQMGMSAESLSRYGAEYAKVQKRYEAALDKLNKAQKKVEAATNEYNNATEDELKNAEMRQDIADGQKRLLIINKEEQQKNKENDEKVKQAQRDVHNLELSALKKRARQLLAEVSEAGDSTPEGKRRQKMADVYTNELQRREDAARRAREQVVQQGRDSQGKAAEVVARAGVVAEKASRTQSVDLSAAAKVLDQAFKTKSLSDNAAALQMYKVLENLMTTAQKATREANILRKKYEQLAQKTARNGMN